MPDLTIALFLSLFAVVGCTIFHLEALGLAQRLTRWQGHRYLLVPGVLVAVLATHLSEIGGYALVYYLGDKVLGIGSFAKTPQPGFAHLYYFAAETYASLGLGDVVPNGSLRLIVAVGSINGILLLTWSGAFLYSFAQTLQRRA